MIAIGMATGIGGHAFYRLVRKATQITGAAKLLTLAPYEHGLATPFDYCLQGHGVASREGFTVRFPIQHCLASGTKRRPFPKFYFIF